MNIVEIIKQKLKNIPIELYELELQNIVIGYNTDKLFFVKKSTEKYKLPLNKKLVSFNNETYYIKESICLYDKSNSRTNVGFLKETDKTFGIMPVATCWKDSIDSDTKKILNLLDIKMIERDIHFYDQHHVTVIDKLVLK